MGILAAASTLAVFGEPAMGPACAMADDAACRCKQFTLAEYYDQADEVLVARLVRADTAGHDRVLRLVVEERPWKPGLGMPAAGDTVRYLTGSSSASCGVPSRPGAAYLVFARRNEVDSLPRVDICSGTRARGADPTGEGWGFDDVPDRFVHGHLDALSGLDHLRELGQANLLGLLEIDAFGRGGSVRLYARPDAAAPVVAAPATYDGLATREVDYEEPAAVAAERVEGWFRVRTSEGGDAWIRATDAGAWHPYETLPVARLAYLTSAWSGHVWPEPGAGIPTRSARKNASGRQEYAVDVLESATIGGYVWFRVAVLDGDPCTGTQAPRPELTGWVPGYGPSGDPALWYYSRGC